MEKKGYKIEDIYQGGYSSFKPTALGTSNYPIQTGNLGLTTDPRNANLLQEISTKLSSGVKHLEIEAISPEYLDSVPKQHLKEVQRLSKLTGVDVSVHGPVMDVAGISRNGFSEVERELAERKVFQTLQQSHELDPDGNILVNFHSAEGIPASQIDMTKEGKKTRKLIVVNKDSGRMAPLEEEKRFYPEGERGKEGEIKPEIHSPEKNLEILNHSEWDNALNQLFFNKERADEILQKYRPLVQDVYEDVFFKKKYPLKDLPQEHKEVLLKVRDADVYLNEIHKQVNSLFSRAYEFGNEGQKEILQNLSKEYLKDLGKPEGAEEVGRFLDPFNKSKAMHNLLLSLQGQFEKDGKIMTLAPEINVPIEKFALEKSATTFGNAVFESYKKFKDKSPVLVIENPPAGFALSTGEDIVNIVKQSREQFVKKAVSEGVSESEAEKQSKKLIGATWDVGHINMLRKFGYKEEDIVEESKKVAPFIKHVHLSDNFGFEHTELPMGMGNVPLKEIMKQLGKKGFEASKIIEAAQWWQHFKTSPFHVSAEMMGSPIYSTRVSPYWNQAIGLHQDYFGGYGLMLPQINYEIFGAGFSQLPSELGGTRPGAQGSRMSGKQME